MDPAALATLARLVPAGPPTAPFLHLPRPISRTWTRGDRDLSRISAIRPAGLSEDLLTAARRLWPADLWATPGIALAVAPTRRTDPGAPGALDAEIPEMALHAEGPAHASLAPTRQDSSTLELILALLDLPLFEGRIFLRRPSPSAHDRAAARALIADLPVLPRATLQGWSPPGLLLWRQNARTLLLAQADPTHRWRLLGAR